MTHIQEFREGNEDIGKDFRTRKEFNCEEFLEHIQTTNTRRVIFGCGIPSLSIFRFVSIFQRGEADNSTNFDREL